MGCRWPCCAPHPGRSFTASTYSACKAPKPRCCHPARSPIGVYGRPSVPCAAPQVAVVHPPGLQGLSTRPLGRVPVARRAHDSPARPSGRGAPQGGHPQPACGDLGRASSRRYAHVGGSAEHGTRRGTFGPSTHRLHRHRHARAHPHRMAVAHARVGHPGRSGHGGRVGEVDQVPLQSPQRSDDHHPADQQHESLQQADHSAAVQLPGGHPSSWTIGISPGFQATSCCSVDRGRS